MKIGFDAKRYFANYTGLGNYSRTLIENLVTFHAENNYCLFTHKAEPKTLQNFPLNESNVSVHMPRSLSSRINGSIWRSFLIKQDIVAEGLDIYHGLSHEIPVGIQRQKDLKTVVTIHDLIFLRYPEFYRWTERAIYLRKFRYACNHADKIISVSDQTKKDIVDYFGIAEAKIQTIHQSCDPVFQQRLETNIQKAVRDRYGLPSEYLLYVGSFNKRKNLLGLVEAVSRMKQFMDVPLVMVGGGKQYMALVRDKIADLQMEKRVFIRSDVPNEDLPAIYQSATLFVYPSIYEGFGIPIIEALASGIPVITSKDGCFPEAGGPDTRYVDPENIEEIADAMEEVLTDSGLAARMIEKGCQYVQRFEGKVTSSLLIDLYKRLVQ